MGRRYAWASQTMPDLTTPLCNRSFRYSNVNKLSTILRIVFAPVLMQNSNNSNRDYPFRPVTIKWQADQGGRPVDFTLNQNNK